MKREPRIQMIVERMGPGVLCRDGFLGGDGRRLEEILRKGLLICTTCGYCMPCPHGVDIPGNFLLASRATLLGLRDHAMGSFRQLRKHKDGDKSALACKKCGKCLTKCPNNIPIIDQLAETAELLTGP